MKKQIITLAATAAVLVGCSTATEPQSAPPVEPAPESAVEPMDEREVQALSLQIVWDQTSAADQALMCEGYTTFGPDFTVESMNSGIPPEDAIPADLIIAHFEKECG